jgi:Tol biopolymer transport system component
MKLEPGLIVDDRYRLIARIGSGGMADVWRAHDAELGRDVALKLLPDAFAQDKDRLARFRREAQVLASLNHPHIAAIYGVEETDSKLALVLELVEGESLDERLKRGAIPVEDALSLARQIALGLEAAHEKGIVHRDLKPANVKITPDGSVKLLDFGLAKAYEGDTAASGDASQSPTLSRHMTEAGLILGTAAYMSPEQARGKAVDRRADVWAFGVVLFEMLTAQRLFEGETVSDTLAAVLRQEIDWAKLPAAAPASVRRVLRRCLERDPKRRLHHVGDARIEIEEAGAEPQALAISAPVAKASWLPWLVAGALAIALAVVVARSPASSPAPVTRLDLDVTGGAPLPPLWGANAVLSPDGRTLAFVAGEEAPQGRRTLFVRRLDADKAVALSGTEGVRSPFFAPDGRSIAFFASGNLMRIDAQGGAPVRICSAVAAAGRGGTWSDNGEIVFTGGFDQPLSRVSADGGGAVPVTTLDIAKEERSHRWPEALPGGKAVLFMTQRTGQDYDDADIEVATLPGGARKLLVHGGAFPRYLPGFLLYAREGALFAAGFDAERLEVTSPGRRVLDGVLSWTGDQEGSDGSAEYALSGRGDILYRAAARQELQREARFVWVDAQGKESPAFAEPLRVLDFELSPDGKKLAFEARSSRGMGLYIRDLERGGTTPFTPEGSGDRNPVWSPDGRKIAFSTRPPEGGARVVRIRALDGGVPDRDIPAVVHEGTGATAWSPDGRTLLVNSMYPQTLGDIFVVPLEEGAKPRPLAQSPQLDGGGRISPNGRWVAYASSEAGVSQVYATALAGGPRWQVSTDQGSQPRWSRDGRQVLFARNGDLFAASVEEHAGGLRLSAPRQVFNIRTFGPIDRPSYDVHPDGRLLVMKLGRAGEDSAADQRHAVLIFNWLADLKRRMRESQ